MKGKSSRRRRCRRRRESDVMRVTTDRMVEIRVVVCPSSSRSLGCTKRVNK